MVNLATNLTTSATRHADRTAVRLDAEALSYAALDDLSSRVAGWLEEKNVGPGDRVGLMLPGVPAFVALYYGILRVGGVVVPMNPLLKEREIRHYVADSGAKLVFVWHEMVPAAEGAIEAAGSRLVPVAPDAVEVVANWPVLPETVDRADSDTALILYTSGTTGSPKGAELTHSNLRLNAAACGDMMEVTSDDVILGCLPLFHAFGQTCVQNNAVQAGATVTLLPRFTAEGALQVIERDGVTVLQGVPTMYVALLDAGGGVADTATLRLCVSGGAALPAEILRSFADVFGVPILEGYGLSETSPTSSFNHRGDTRAGSIGKPLSGVEMKIVDDTGAELAAGEVGEIVIKGPNVMKGYWNRPEETAAAVKDGWFRTGDIGRRDADGFFFIVDRKKDLIIRGGYNVYPREVEELLYEHPAVLEAAVVGVPDPTYGEEVAAAVVLKPGADASAEQLREYVKDRISPQKYPRHVWLVDSLPKTATGKIVKREIEFPVGRG
ncbi:long-chain fatty acid--CoA ligase [Pseudonocardia ailaonensis]|uniref:Long-chain fatty acid--CoA ligase n=1 Tax=Pseudonocardia ailaonensis TaxID=367279 RepID=A0ABN2N8Y6_9PSEU